LFNKKNADFTGRNGFLKANNVKPFRISADLGENFPSQIDWRPLVSWWHYWKMLPVRDGAGFKKKLMGVMVYF
jgi:hypothetical protein